MTMPNDDAKRFRQRALECRKIADEAGNAEWRSWLLDLAKDLEDEAERSEAED